MAKAMVLKRAGDPVGAAQAMQQAQELDGQDRFLNGKLAKYVLRAGDVKRAEDLLALFTKVRDFHLGMSCPDKFCSKASILWSIWPICNVFGS